MALLVEKANGGGNGRGGMGGCGMTRQEIIDALSFCASDARFPREECGEACPLFLPAYSGVKKR